MKILFLSYRFPPDIGGIETVSEILANAFDNAGHDVRVITYSSRTEINKFHYQVIRNPGIWKLFRQHQWADIVFENNPSIRLSWPTFFLRRSSMVTLQTWISQADSKPTLNQWLKYRRLKKASQVIACSEAVRLGIWPEAVVIGNPYREDLCKVIDGISRTRDFIFLGRLVSDKGIDIALKAFSKFLATEKLHKPEVQLNFTIVGDGPEKENIIRLIKEMHLEDYITLKGAMKGEDLVRCLNEHRFILVPSIWKEPFGIVALEGMACGCIPIVADSGGLPDAVGNAGITFRSGDAESLTMAIQSIFANPSKIADLLKASVEHLKAHGFEEISKQYLSLMKVHYK